VTVLFTSFNDSDVMFGSRGSRPWSDSVSPSPRESRPPLGRPIDSPARLDCLDDVSTRCRGDSSSVLVSSKRVFSRDLGEAEMSDAVDEADRVTDCLRFTFWTPMVPSFFGFFLRFLRLGEKDPSEEVLSPGLAEILFCWKGSSFWCLSLLSLSWCQQQIILKTDI
jgi:hypothetical protein